MSEIEIRVVSRQADLSALDQTDRKVKELGGSLKRVGEVAAGFLLGNAVQAGARRAMALMQSTVRAASDLGESINAVEKTFESAAGTIKAFGETSAEQVGLSARAFNQMATPLGAILKNQGLAVEKVADETVNLTKRAADMASVFNTDVSDALMAIQAGLRGETEPLRRYGVTLSEVAIQQQALAMSGKTAARDLTNQEKALARLSLIYAQSASTAGDFQDTVDGLANSQRVSQARIEDAQAKIGTAYLPIMSKAAQITGQFAEVFSSMPGPVQTVTAMIVAVGAAAVIAAPRILMAKNALQQMAASGSLAAKSLGLVVSALTKIGTTVFVVGIVRQVLQEFGILNDVLGAIPGIGDELQRAYGDIDQSLTFVEKKTGEQITAQRGLTTAIDETIKAGETMIGVWDKLHGKAVDADREMLEAKEAIAGLKDTFKENKNAIEGNSTAALENRVALADAAKAAAEAAQAYFDQTGDAKGASAMMDTFRRAAEKSIGATGKAKDEVHDLAVELFKLPAFKEVTVQANIVVTGRGQLNRAMKDVERLTGEGFAHGGITGAAAGGARGGMTWVGEQGPELVRLPYGSTVYPSGQSMAMAGGGGGGSMRIVVEDRTASGIRAKLIADGVDRGIPEAQLRVAYP